MIEDFLKRAEQAIFYRFTPHFNDLNMNLATLLDARFKDEFTNEHFGINNISNALFQEYERINKISPDIFFNFEHIEENAKHRKPLSQEDYDNFWTEFENSNMLKDNSERESFNTELKLYLMEKKIKKDTNLSLFWINNSQTYQRLSVLARRYLTPLPTSANSERCFSLSEEIISKKRTSLCPETVEMIEFLNKNFGLCMLVK